jgi:hypothetical protein
VGRSQAEPASYQGTTTTSAVGSGAAASRSIGG